MTSLFLLNTFFPPRHSDSSIHYRLLNRIWYCTTGLLNGYLPESLVHRFLAPHLSKAEISCYSAPYEGLPRSAKSSIQRFSHSIPTLPRFVLFQVRQTTLWKIIEGLLGAAHFDSLNTQARLSAHDDQVRRYWGCQPEENACDVAVVFGDKDPLVRDYKAVLTQRMHPERMAQWAPRGLWVMGSGHMPMEGKPGEVSGLIAQFAREE